MDDCVQVRDLPNIVGNHEEGALGDVFRADLRFVLIFPEELFFRRKMEERIGNGLRESKRGREFAGYLAKGTGNGGCFQTHAGIIGAIDISHQHVHILVVTSG